MSIIYESATIRNPADPGKVWVGRFLIDTGATDCVVPRKHLEEIGLEAKDSRVYELADGSEITMDVTTADVEFMGRTVGATIVFAEADTEPILGVTVMESAGVEIDPRNEVVRLLPSIRLT